MPNIITSISVKDLFGLKLQRHAVHAVAKTGRTRTVGEDVAQVTAAVRAVHFGARHEMAAVFGRLDGTFERQPEARPTGPAFELGVRGEQAAVRMRHKRIAVTLFLVQRTRSGALGAVLAQHLKLARRERLLPLLFGLLHRKGLVFHNVSLPFR